MPAPTKTFHQLIVAAKIMFRKILRPNSGFSKNKLISVRYVKHKSGVAICLLSLHCHTGSEDKYLRTQMKSNLDTVM